METQVKCQILFAQTKLINFSPCHDIHYLLEKLPLSQSFSISSVKMFSSRLVLLVFVLISIKNSFQAESSDIVQVVKRLVFDEHRREIKIVNVINGLEKENKREINDFMQDLFIEIGSIFTFRSVNLSQLIRKTKLFFNVISINSLDSFNHFKSELSSEFFNFGGYYVIVFETATFEEVSIILRSLWDTYINNVNVLTRNKSNNSINVMTFVPFGEHGCNITTPIKIAEFSDGKFLHQPKTFFPDKFRNFHKCPLKVGTFESLAPSVLREDFSNGSYRLYGRDVEVMTALAQYLNFTNDVFYITPYGGWGFIYPNGTVTGAIGRAFRRESDYVLGNLYLQYNRSMLLEFSYTYFLDDLVLVIPPGKLLTSFQKLFRPFDVSVWVILSGTILFAFMIIAILEFQSERLREFCYGKGIRNPYMNVTIAIFGGSQHSVPSTNFARSLLMMFLLFCLVIR